MKNYYLLILLVATMLATGCTKPRFHAIAKENAIQDPIFDDFVPGEGDGNDLPPGEEDGDDTNPPGEDDGDDTNPPGENDDDTNPPGEDDGDDTNPPGEDDGDDNPPGEDDDDDTPPGEDDLTQVPVDLLCSDSRTRKVGYNLKSSVQLEVQIVDNYGNVVCSNSQADLKSLIINDKILPMAVCENATGLQYYLRLIDPTRNNDIKLRRDGTVKKFDDLLNYSSQQVKIVRDSTSEAFRVINSNSPRRTIEVLYAGNRSNKGDPLCDRRASPLIIKTDANDKGGIKLTSQKDGVFFDILGENSFPREHAKKRISWLTKSSYMFVVKPNAYGQVKGINEMFGDNTKGPDGKFAENGYAALAKFDINQDKVIDAHDAIFSQLKLWSDKDLDGRAQRRELISLAEAGVVSIDLVYDESYSETDRYGNQVNMKSVVQYSDGSYRLIFDLWFNYVDKRHSRRR